MCERCQRNASQLKTAAMELHPITVIATPQVWHLVGMDLIGPFKPSALGCKFVLTVTDYTSVNMLKQFQYLINQLILLQKEFTKSTVDKVLQFILLQIKAKNLSIRYSYTANMQYAY